MKNARFRQIPHNFAVEKTIRNMKANEIKGEEIEISTKDSKVKVYIVPTNEELMIARETLNLVK